MPNGIAGQKIGIHTTIATRAAFPASKHQAVGSIRRRNEARRIIAIPPSAVSSGIGSELDSARIVRCRSRNNLRVKVCPSIRLCITIARIWFYVRSVSTYVDVLGVSLVHTESLGVKTVVHSIVQSRTDASAIRLTASWVDSSVHVDARHRGDKRARHGVATVVDN